MKQRKLALTIGLLIVAALATGTRADFVRNGSFTGGGDEWLWYGTAVAQWDQACLGETAQVAVIVQVVPVADLAANTPWEVSFSAINAGMVEGQGVQAYMDYYDSNNTLLGSSDITDLIVYPDNTYRPGYTFSGITPDNVNYAYGKLALWRLRTDVNGGLRIDDVVGNIVPEPTTMCLLGLGGLAAILRRQKQ